MNDFKPGDMVECHGADGSNELVNYRGDIDGDTACVVGANGYQFSIPRFRLKAAPKAAPKIGVGDTVSVKGGNRGTVEDIQGMFFLVRVAGAVEHFHRSEVKAGS